MELVHECSKSGLQAFLIRELGDERASAEKELLDAGVPLALPHRTAWAEQISRWKTWFLFLRDASGRACAGVAIEVVRTRALPGYSILRVDKFGANLPEEVCRVALEAAAKLAKSTPRVLRMEINVFSRNRRNEISEMLGQLGFKEVVPPNSYQHTLVIEMSQSEDEIFASFSTSARRNIRTSIKMSLQPNVITDLLYAERLNELQQQAMTRTGGHSSSIDWQSVIKMSIENPKLSRVVGLFPGEDRTPENMGAFVWICNNGDHMEYRAAGSIRRTDIRIPLGYLLMWDMIRWAKESGMEWFDIGGVTLEEGKDSGLEGISQFKRHFSSQVAEVGAEWALEPAPVQAKIANLISDGAERVRGWMRKTG